MTLTDYQAKFFAYALTREGGSGVERLQQSLLNASVDLNPHQVEAALFALRSPISKGVLLADEVGLGKTIEAGLVMCQLWAERKRKILVVCPASLRKQWQVELEEKFNLPSVVVDAKSARDIQKEGVSNPYSKNVILISSYSFAAKKKDWLREIQWDLVVIDEAHKLRNSYRESNQIGKALRWALADRRKILLTATPLQNNVTELYGISTLLDESYFGDLATFRSRYVNGGGDLPALRMRMAEFSWRTLRRDVEAFVRYTKRFPITEKFTCSDIEDLLYTDVSAYLQDELTYAFPQTQRGMLTLLVRKVQASSTVALAGTLEKILARLKSLQKPTSASPKSLLNSLLEEDPDLVEEMTEDREEVTVSADTTSETAQAEETQKTIDPKLLQAEIERVTDLLERAYKIGADKKTQHLLKALETGWGRLKELGAEEKAVIFTESRRTMAFLKEYLEANGYANQVVCFSGGGGTRDETSEAIYKRYKEEHPEDKSSKAIMMRHALIDAFRHDAKILISTEAGAEGINLQFCSMVVNYDLPWNPQRVEQRIGRCHRYGQKYDVLVINFLNTRNAADVRIYDLLTEKFCLFRELFGASNDILGVGDKDGKSFEWRINEILQKCRTTEEIEAAFDKLRQELEEDINARMQQTQDDILENLDDDVRRLLRVDYDKAKDFLSESESRFMMLTHHVLRDHARFNADDPTLFELVKPPSNSIAPGSYKLSGGELPPHTLAYRPNSELGEWAISTAKALPTPFAEVVFDISNYQGRLTAIEQMKGQSGYLLLDKMRINALDEDGYLLFTGFTNDGTIVPPEDLERLFSLPQSVRDSGILDSASAAKLGENAALLAKSTLQKSMENTNKIFQERLKQLDGWADDQIAVAEHELATVKNELRTARHEQEIASNQEELQIAASKVDTLERKRAQARRKLYDVEDQVEDERRRIREDLKKKMVQDVKNETLFIIKWKIV